MPPSPLPAFVHKESAQHAIRYALVGATAFAWIFNVVTLGSCRMVSINTNAVHLGIFRRSLQGARCAAYGTVLDAPHWLARCASVLTNLCLLVSMVGMAVLLKTEWKQKKVVWTVTKRVWEVALACTLGTFVFFLSDWRFVLCRATTTTCKNGSATSVTVLNVLLLIGMVVVAEWLVTTVPGTTVELLRLQRQPTVVVKTEAVPSAAADDDKVTTDGTGNGNDNNKTGHAEESKEEELAPTMSEMLQAQTGQQEEGKKSDFVMVDA